MMHGIEVLDWHVLAALYAARSDLWIQAFIGLGEAVEAYTVAGVFACAALSLLLRRRRAELSGLAVSVFGSAGATFSLKELIGRSRPPQQYQALFEHLPSFPSWHAALSVGLWGFLAYLLWRKTRTRAGRASIVALTMTFLVAVDFSRLYLGVHYLSDVVAGSLVGAVFLALGAWFTKRLEERAAT